MGPHRGVAGQDLSVLVQCCVDLDGVRVRETSGANGSVDELPRVAGSPTDTTHEDAVQLETSDRGRVSQRCCT